MPVVPDFAMVLMVGWHRMQARTSIRPLIYVQC